MQLWLFMCEKCTPPMETISPRHFWYMGHVKYRYIHYDKSRDHYVCKKITCVSFPRTEFTVYPSYVDKSGNRSWRKIR